MSTTQEMAVTYSSSSTFLQSPGAANQISTLIPIQPTEENYLLWKSLFLSILRASGDMLDLAEGRERCRPRYLSEEKEVENADYADWIRRDRMLLTWIHSSLSLSLLARTAYFTSGRALWLHLENRFADKAKAHVLELKDRLKNLNMRGYSTTSDEYVEIAKEIRNGLEAAGSPIDDSEYVSRFLNGLPRTRIYKDFVASTRARPEPVTPEQLHESLLQYSPLSALIIPVLLWATVTSFILGAIVQMEFYIIFLLVLLGWVIGIWKFAQACSTIRESDDSTYLELHTECLEYNQV